MIGLKGADLVVVVEVEVTPHATFRDGCQRLHLLSVFGCLDKVYHTCPLQRLAPPFKRKHVVVPRPVGRK